MSLHLQVKKHLNKRVHCSNNRIKLKTPIVCDWCLQEDKRKTKFFWSCRAYYFHLQFCARISLFPLVPTLEEKIIELQKHSDKISGDQK